MQPSETDTIDEIDNNIQKIKEQIEYDILCYDYPKERLNEVVELITDVYTSNCSMFGTVPLSLLKRRFRQLTDQHIRYVFECIDNNRTEIKNIKAYLIKSLYNAPSTMEHYYQAQVKRDMVCCG